MAFIEVAPLFIHRICEQGGLTYSTIVLASTEKWMPKS